MDVDFEKQEVIDEHIRYLVSEILHNISNVETILLCGSYGRNEGAWIKGASGNFIPYNDYDFIVISDKPDITKESLSLLRERVAKRLKINWIDIDIYNSNKIKKLRPSQKNIDITFGSKRVYGNEIKWNLKLSDMVKLGSNDIETLYFTRIWTFLGTYLYREKELINGNEVMFFRYQMAKAVLACADVILIKQHNYHYSYIERVKRVLLCNIEDNWKDLFKWAVKQKMQPDGSSMEKREVIDLYESTLEMYYTVMKYGIGREFCFYRSRKLFDLCYAIKPRHFLVSLYRVLSGRYVWDVRFRKVFSMQNSILMFLCGKAKMDSLYYKRTLNRYFALHTDETLNNIIKAVSDARLSL